MGEGPEGVGGRKELSGSSPPEHLGTVGLPIDEMGVVYDLLGEGLRLGMVHLLAGFEAHP